MLTLTLLCALCACGSSDDNETTKDMTPPVISEEGIVATPTDCQVYQRGGVIPFNIVFKDDTELGSYNIEIHNNFDHHTHSTTIQECPMDEKKWAASPWVYNQDFTIPEKKKEFTARIDIPIPTEVLVHELKDSVTHKVIATDTIMPLQPGDYHFAIRLTDKAGWQQIHAVAIKIQ